MGCVRRLQGAECSSQTLSIQLRCSIAQAGGLVYAGGSSVANPEWGSQRAVLLEEGAARGGIAGGFLQCLLKG